MSRNKTTQQTNKTFTCESLSRRLLLVYNIIKEPFQRKVGLGRYNATRCKWLAAYRNARCISSAGKEPDASVSGVAWKAQLIVAHKRCKVDKLVVFMDARLRAKMLINEILSNDGVPLVQEFVSCKQGKEK